MVKTLTKKTTKTKTMFGEEAYEVTTRKNGAWTTTDAVFSGIKSKFWKQDVDYRISVSVFEADGYSKDTEIRAGRNYGLSFWDATNRIELGVPPQMEDDAIEFIWKMIREGKV